MARAFDRIARALDRAALVADRLTAGLLARRDGYAIDW